MPFALPRLSTLGAARSGAEATLPLHIVVGWFCAGLLNVAYDRYASAAGDVRAGDAVSHAVDLGRHVGLGLASALAVWAFRRFIPKWPLAHWLAFACASIGLGALILPTDLEGLAERSAESGMAGASLVLGAIVVAIGLAVPAVAWVTRARTGSTESTGGLSSGWLSSGWLGRTWAVLRVLLALAIAALAFWLNVTTSPGTNPSAHLYLSWLTAVALAHALPRLELGLPRVSVQSVVPVVLVLGWSLWALFGPHSNTVMIQVARRPSSLHLAALFHTDGGLDTVGAALAAQAGPFFSSRAGMSSVPPTPRQRTAASPIVIFFSIDSFRHDILTDARHSKQMPQALELMNQGVTFSNARAPGSMTKYTLGSISSGRYFSQQLWEPRGQGHWPSRDESVHIASVLSGAGTFTAAFPATRWLENSLGIMRGFDQNEHSGDPMPGRQQHWIDGGSLTRQLIATLEREAARPGFYWVHYLDSHDPFYAGGKGGKKFARYLRALHVIDGYLGEVRAAVRRLGLEQRVLLFLMSDHGEAFGEHGSYFHGGSLYDELVRVPLVVHGAGIVPREVATPVSLVDLGPTVLDWFGVATPASFMGESLVPFLLGNSREFERPIVAETGLKQSMLFGDGRKVIRDLRRRTLEVYDLGQDPGELSNLSDDIDPDQEEHVLLLRSFFQVHTYRENGYRVPYVK